MANIPVYCIMIKVHCKCIKVHCILIMYLLIWHKGLPNYASWCGPPFFFVFLLEIDQWSITIQASKRKQNEVIGKIGAWVKSSKEWSVCAPELLIQFLSFELNVYVVLASNFVSNLAVYASIKVWWLLRDSNKRTPRCFTHNMIVSQKLGGCRACHSTGFVNNQFLMQGGTYL